MPYFQDAKGAFELSGASWRVPQLGGLGALIAHWSLDQSEPGLISIPTGAGKTAMAMAAPFVLPRSVERVLVVVPSTQLRKHMAEHFRSQEQLKRIGAITDVEEGAQPNVVEVVGRNTVANDFEDVDVVVALPNSISPSSMENPLPEGLFDLIVIDEAHHAPATTWRSLLNHYDAPSLLLTATPFRRDKKAIPGKHLYYYPLRRALDEGFYKPIEPRILEPPAEYDRPAVDARIRDEVQQLLAQEEHDTSAVLIRSASIARAKELRQLYADSGVDIEVLHSGLSTGSQNTVVDRLQDGTLRGVAVVGMLGEGFDLPSLRIVAYHDKHKSLPATVQLVGRLARVDTSFPQPSVLVTVGDTDVYPELKGVVRELYEEDADWQAVFPGVIDDEVQQIVADREFVSAMTPQPARIDGKALAPMPKPIVLEEPDIGWRPGFHGGLVPADLRMGEFLTGDRILHSSVTSDGRMLVMVTERRYTPPWSNDPALESIEHQLHVVSFRPSPAAGLPSFLFVDSDDNRIRGALIETIASDDAHRVSPERLDEYLQALDRVSITSIGMRNVLVTTRGASYRMLAGRSADVGLTRADSARSTLGHLMMQANSGAGTASIGAAFEKGKLWERRYKPLREYHQWVSSTAHGLWYPPGTTAIALLPQLARSVTIDHWPDSRVLAVEIHPGMLSGEYQLFGEDGLLGRLDDLSLYAEVDPTGTVDLPRTADEIAVVGVLPTGEGQEEVVWRGLLYPDGSTTCVGNDLRARRGYGDDEPVAELLNRFPPTVFFTNGQTAAAGGIADTRQGLRSRYDPRSVLAHSWVDNGVDIGAETRRSAEQRQLGRSIFEELEAFIGNRPRTRRYRWVLCNDGPNELADFISIDYSPPSDVGLAFWHAKGAAGNAPGLRVDDFQVVTAQAVRSIRRFSETGIWDEILARLLGRSSPPATVIPGGDSVPRLLALLGMPDRNGRQSPRSWPRLQPLPRGEIWISQPGLSKSLLEVGLADGTNQTANSIREMLASLSDAALAIDATMTVVSSP